jgi:hypothetical protein
MASANSCCRNVAIWGGILIFIVCICLPMADHALHLAPPVSLMENDPTPLPEYSLSQAFKFFNVLQRGYLEKTFGFRKLLVRLQNILDIFWLRSASHYQTVIKGKSNWLFLSQENSDLNVVDDYRSGRLFNPAQLERWVNIYKERQEWLAKRGIHYLIVVAPNKHTVYPEFLPDQYNRINPISRTDQLMQALTAAGVEALDLRPVMAEVKTKALAYYRTDTHWTTFGAFAGYVQIMKTLAKWFPRFEPDIRGNFDITISPDLNGGLASMLALSDLFPEERVSFIPQTPRRAVESTDPNFKRSNFQPSVVMETGDSDLPKAVIIRDSFAHELVPFLSEHFSRALYLWPYPSTSRAIRDFDKEAIEREKPDIVIDEFVERYFTEFPAKPKTPQP